MMFAVDIDTMTPIPTPARIGNATFAQNQKRASDLDDCVVKVCRNHQSATVATTSPTTPIGQNRIVRNDRSIMNA